MQLSLPRFKTNPTLMGLDIGSSSVKAIELSRQGQSYEVVRFGMAPLPPEAIVQGAFLNTSAIVEAIQAAVAQAEIKLKDVATAVSGHSVIVKKITMQEMSREQLGESIRWEAEQYIPFDVNEVNLDFEIVEGSQHDGQMDVVLVAAKKDLLDDYVQVISEAGLNAAVVDVAGFAVENAFEANEDVDSADTVAILNIGAQVVNINIVSRHVPLFTRDVNLGGAQYTEEIQKTLSIGFEEAEQIKLGGGGEAASQDVMPQEVEQAVRSTTQSIVGEIARSLEFYTATAADSRIDRIVLAGGAAQVSGLARAFEERMGIPVSVLDPLERVTPGKGADPERLGEISPSLAVGIGLALRRLVEL